MDLLQEYKNQNLWREWERYIERLPVKGDQTVYDLGCSVGSVSRLFASKAKKVVGFDSDEKMLAEANREKPSNCEFVMADIAGMDPEKLEKADGIWISFALAYMADPGKFIARWSKCLKPGGWMAVADIDGLLSCHLPKENPYAEAIAIFEKGSDFGRGYDHQIGRKIGGLLRENGFGMIVSEDNWFDRELNFSGKASPQISSNWKARLYRMNGLKSYLGKDFSNFMYSFLQELSRESHVTDKGVKFYVGVKS